MRNPHAATPMRAARPLAPLNSRVDSQPCQGLAQYVIGVVTLAALAPDTSRFILLAERPQDLTQVSGNLGIGS